MTKEARGSKLRVDIGNPRPGTFSASTLTPSEVEWLKQDSRRAADLFTRMAEDDARLSAMLEAERGASAPDEGPAAA